MSTHHVFASNRINSPRQYPYHLLNYLTSLSWISLHKAKIRDYPSGLEPDLKPRKVLIYLSYYTLTYQPLTSILPSQRALYVYYEYLVLICMGITEYVIIYIDI